jgi:uncharacterized damage-inducible protein DinB
MRTWLFAFLVLETVTATGQGSPEAQVVRQLEARWLASSEYTLAVAEQMPADKYVFRPTPEQMTFGQQLHHISQQNRMIFREIQGLAAGETQPVALGKPDVVLHLKETTALGLKLLQQRTSSASADVAELLNGMMLALDHTTHHRGQAVVYLRLNGMTPPDYRR